ncbi:MAG TPA: hypothetical protein VGE07_18025, partial [Herpetosiphonaceae bacterium]
MQPALPSQQPIAAASRRSWWQVPLVALGLLAGPLVLLVLRLFPELDWEFQSPPFHFWIVTSASLVTMVVIFLAMRIAVVRRDGRVLLIGFGFLAL